MSAKRGNAEKPKLRMDVYSNRDKDDRQKGVLNPRREIDKVIKKARRDGDTTSAYWTQKLLEVEEKEPDRWHHSGYKELYVSNGTTTSDATAMDSPMAKKRVLYSPSAPTSPIAPVRASRKSTTPSRRNDHCSVSPDLRGGGSSRTRTDRFCNSTRPRGTVSPPLLPPFRRAKSPNGRASRSPVRRSRSPPPNRRNKGVAGRRAAASPIRRSRSSSPLLLQPPRARKPSPRRAASPPLRSARSPLRTKSPSSRHPKQDRARNRSVDKLLTSTRRKKSPKAVRYKTLAASRSRSTSPAVRRRDKVRSRSPLLKANKRRLAHKTKYRDSSSSRSGFSSRSPARKKAPKQIISTEVLSSSDCSDSNCSMCRFEKNTKEKKKTKTNRERAPKRPSPTAAEPRAKPRSTVPTRLPITASSSRYARSRSLSAAPVATSPVEDRRLETKHKKRSKKEKKKMVVKASKAITTSIIHNKKIKVESPSDESESPSPKRVTLSDRFGKMAKWGQKKDVESSNQRNIRVTAGDNYRVEELDVPLLEPFPEPSPLVLDGSWDDVRVRYSYYKDHGYLEDLSFQDYLKWEEWWYSYQEWLETERLHSMRRRL